MPHEWPLPSDPLQAKAVVFELDCPPAFGVWRATTYQVLHDICKLNQRQLRNHPFELDGNISLQKYMVHKPVKITLASDRGPHHSRMIPIPTDKKSVCITNDLQYSLFYKIGNTWASNFAAACNIASYCTLRLPTNSPYSFLQYVVDGTSHTSNHVLAEQSNCSNDLNLHKYISFASLQSGSRLQWLNIARELRARSLSFHKEEVHILLTQAAWQTGCLSADGHMEWHAELNSKHFGMALLTELNALLDDVRASWLESTTMNTIVALAG